MAHRIGSWLQPKTEDDSIGIDRSSQGKAAPSTLVAAKEEAAMRAAAK
jgi:hypothetical protein